MKALEALNKPEVENKISKLQEETLKNYTNLIKLAEIRQDIRNSISEANHASKINSLMGEKALNTKKISILKAFNSQFSDTNSDDIVDMAKKLSEMPVDRYNTPTVERVSLPAINKEESLKIEKQINLLKNNSEEIDEELLALNNTVKIEIADDTTKFLKELGILS